MRFFSSSLRLAWVSLNALRAGSICPIKSVQGGASSEKANPEMPTKRIIKALAIIRKSRNYKFLRLSWTRKSVRLTLRRAAGFIDKYEVAHEIMLNSAFGLMVSAFKLRY